MERSHIDLRDLPILDVLGPVRWGLCGWCSHLRVGWLVDNFDRLLQEGSEVHHQQDHVGPRCRLRDTGYHVRRKGSSQLGGLSHFDL